MIGMRHAPSRIAQERQAKMWRNMDKTNQISEVNALKAKVVELEAERDDYKNHFEAADKARIASQERVAELEGTIRGMGAALRIANPYKERANKAETRVAELEAQLKDLQLEKDMYEERVGELEDLRTPKTIDKASKHDVLLLYQENMYPWGLGFMMGNGHWLNTLGDQIHPTHYLPLPMTPKAVPDV